MTNVITPAGSTFIYSKRLLAVFGIIYKITNTKDGKVYIGATTQSLRERWNHHKHSALRHKTKRFLHNAIFSDGYEQFKRECLKTCYSSEQLYAAEIFFIKKYRSCEREFGYNNSTGGKYSSVGKKLTEETKKLISLIQIGKKRKPHSEVTKQYLSAAAKGRDMSKAILASALANKGKPAHNRISVKQYDLSGNLIAIFPSKKAAAAAVYGNQISLSNIKRKNINTYKGFKWIIGN